MSDFESQVSDVLEQVEERNKQKRRAATKYGAQIESDDSEEGDDQ